MIAGEPHMLLVQEFSQKGFWLPGGGVDAGETFQEGAIRETLEEAGVRITLKGVLAFENSPGRRYSRQRVIFLAEPADVGACAPKTCPDYESVGACWVRERDILEGCIPLRGREPLEWAAYCRDGGEVHSMSLLRESKPRHKSRR
jgi:ADP-ribose pyrophosphatase YjhB (NUDIX family)